MEMVMEDEEELKSLSKMIRGKGDKVQSKCWKRKEQLRTGYFFSGTY